MLKKTLLTLALASLAAPTIAAEYYIVVPFKKVAAPAANIAVSLNSLAVERGVVGVPFTALDLKAALQVSGDNNFSASNVSWTIDSGTLPAGLSLSTDGVISGTPTTAGSSNVTVRATYKSASGTQTYELVVLNLNVSLSTAALPNPTPGLAYSFDANSRLTVTGDASFDANKVNWTVASGTLPSGLSLSNKGVLSGTPGSFSTSGTTFALKADYLGKYAQQSYTLYPVDNIPVGALFHFNGTNGSAQFVDEKGVSYVSNGAVISTAQSKFGGASGYFNGSASIDAASGVNLNLSGDFTAESFIRFNSVSNSWTAASPSNQYIFEIGGNGTGGSGSYFIWRAELGWTFVQGGQAILNYASVPNTNQWYHWALQRKGSTLSIFLDGQLVASGTFTNPIGATSTTFRIGNYGGGGPYGVNGYLDEFRITPGVARYNGNFTVPTSEYLKN